MAISTQFAEVANRELDRGLDALERDRSGHLVLATLVGTVVSALAAGALADSADPPTLRALTSGAALIAVGSAVSMFLNSRALFATDPVKRIDHATALDLNADEFLTGLVELKILTYIENGEVLGRVRMIARVALTATVSAIVLCLALLGTG